MNQGTFTGLVTNLCATFGRKSPSRESLDRWWIKVMAVPDEAVPWITDQLEERDDLPKNLPNAVIALWFRWREANPGKCAMEEQPKGCHCCSHGRIYYLRQVRGGKWYPSVATCAHCMTKTNDNAIPWLRVEDIEAHGYEWVSEAKALGLCAERNLAACQAKRGNVDAVGVLDGWKRGQRPDERSPIPDDDRPDLAEGW